MLHELLLPTPLSSFYIILDQQLGRYAAYFGASDPRHHIYIISNQQLKRYAV